VRKDSKRERENNTLVKLEIKFNEIQARIESN
jgi:hypothetical protein